MKIDNDFLTLLDLTVRIERVHQMTMVGRPVAEQMRLSEEIDRMNKDRDALVAKINAADDADAAVAKQTADLTDATQKTNDALAEVLKTIAALNEKPIIHEGRTIEIAGQAKDAAPAPSQPKGLVAAGATLDLSLIHI